MPLNGVERGDQNVQSHQGRAPQRTCVIWRHSERQPSTSQGEASRETKLDDTLILDFSVQNCEKINICVEASQSTVFYYGSRQIQSENQFGGLQIHVQMSNKMFSDISVSEM